MQSKLRPSISLPLMVVAMIFKAFVFTQFWDWFIITTFNVPSLSVPLVIAGFFMYSMVKYNPSNLSHDIEVTWEFILKTLLFTLSAYSYMFIITLAM